MKPPTRIPLASENGPRCGALSPHPRKPPAFCHGAEGHEAWHAYHCAPLRGGGTVRWLSPDPDRAQLEALGTDAPARAHHDRLERERRERRATAEDHFTP